MSGANPLPRVGEVFFDDRGQERALRLSWHPDAQVMVISIWNAGVCSGTFRLSARDIPAFMESLSQGVPSTEPRGRRHVLPERPERPENAPAETQYIAADAQYSSADAHFAPSNGRYGAGQTRQVPPGGGQYGPAERPYAAAHNSAPSQDDDGPGPTTQALDALKSLSSPAQQSSYPQQPRHQQPPQEPVGYQAPPSYQPQRQREQPPYPEPQWPYDAAQGQPPRSRQRPPQRRPEDPPPVPPREQQPPENRFTVTGEYERRPGGHGDYRDRPDPPRR